MIMHIQCKALNVFFFCYFAAVPLDKLLKDPAQFQEFLYKSTKLSPRIVAELFNSTVNVQKVGTYMYVYAAMKVLSTIML